MLGNIQQLILNVKMISSDLCLIQLFQRLRPSESRTISKVLAGQFEKAIYLPSEEK